MEGIDIIDDNGVAHGYTEEDDNLHDQQLSDDDEDDVEEEEDEEEDEDEDEDEDEEDGDE